MIALPYEWLTPPPDGWRLADVERLPEDWNVEIIDGALIVNPSPLPIHQRMVRRLAAQLEPQLPPDWQLETDVDVLLNDEPLDYVTPDVVVFRADLPLTTRPILAADVLLVVEAVSRGSRREDRGAKPLAYAEAGIPHFWRIETPATGAPTTEVHEFARVDGGSEYVPVQVHRGHLNVSDPFAIRLDLEALT